MLALSLAIVGADHPNRRGPTRWFELNLCAPGEPVELRPEPKNPKDPYAVAVYSCRGVQLGYVTAERAPWIGKLIGEGREIVAVFQGKASFGGWARVAFDGEQPLLPVPSVQADRLPNTESTANDDAGFWPDPVWDDE
ncbi:HIRAN domain-containing protein [Sphingomonas gellani]|uniref:HIRAN domain-containing protein n=1 Tax=Sphingomonas gellani TaxID=1166340 RepID=A0A1H7ZC51_9SPHN|nr:HIRAN domain-containing protein [Sphingomonas gellani]SEM55079.1 HIRAN domain-containing protein [Sphingomonas gellani]